EVRVVAATEGEAMVVEGKEVDVTVAALVVGVMEEVVRVGARVAAAKVVAERAEAEMGEADLAAAMAAAVREGAGKAGAGMGAGEMAGGVLEVAAKVVSSAVEVMVEVGWVVG
ncbi:MAG: hypothetical protein SGPRY_006079, partial [Prymnesium sp.]